jgi:hypothetical protein
LAVYFLLHLSRGLLRVAVSHHFALWSPDFPRSSLEINLELQRGDPGDSSVANNTPALR